MARSFDPAKRALWQGRFRRYLDSGLSVARFCAAEDVSESSFYYWHKKLGPLKRRPPGCAEDPAARRADHPVCCVEGGARAEDRATRCGGRSAITDEQRMFRPVTVVPAACGVVVQLPGGARIEVGAAYLDAIRAVVAETVRANQSKAAAGSSSAHCRSPHGRDGVSSC